MNNGSQFRRICLIKWLYILILDEADEHHSDAQAGEDDLDAKAVQAGENFNQLLLCDSADDRLGVAERPDQQELARALAVNEQQKIEMQRLVEDLAQARQIINSLCRERQELREKLDASSNGGGMVSSPRPLPLSSATSFSSPIHRVASPVVVEEGPVCKVAERVRLRRLDDRDKLLTGSQIAQFGVSFYYFFKLINYF